jgi:hypothetical protein
MYSIPQKYVIGERVKAETKGVVQKRISENVNVN